MSFQNQETMILYENKRMSERRCAANQIDITIFSLLFTAYTDDERPVAVTVDDIALVSKSLRTITKVESSSEIVSIINATPSSVFNRQIKLHIFGVLILDWSELLSSVCYFYWKSSGSFSSIIQLSTLIPFFYLAVPPC